MKVYLLKDEDFEELLTAIDRDPSRGTSGGSSQVLTQQQRDAHTEAHRFFNYHIRVWMDKQKR